MPIRVEHGGQAGTTAGQIIAQAGQRGLDRQQHEADRDLQVVQQAQRLQQQRDLTHLGIEAQSDLQKQAADEAMARTALEHGLGGQIQEQEFDNTIEQMREQARLAASQWEPQYTSQQRQEIAKFNNARQAISSSNQWSPEEKAAALKMIDLQQANIQPSMMPRDSSKPIYPEGKGIGETWVDQNGTLIGRKPDGGLQLIQRWDQGPEAAKMKAQETQQTKDIALQARREESLMKMRVDLLTKPVKGIGPDGEPVERYRTPQEVGALMQSVMGGDQAQQAIDPRILSAIQAARSGDTGAQQALSKRGISWQDASVAEW